MESSEQNRIKMLENEVSIREGINDTMETILRHHISNASIQLTFCQRCHLEGIFAVLTSPTSNFGI